MKECTRCGGYMPDSQFYTIGAVRLMSECKQCNRVRKAEKYTPRKRLNLNLGRDRRGRFAAIPTTAPSKESQ